MKRILALAAAAAAAACGSNNSSNAAVTRNSPGTGTNTLLVVGTITATSQPGSSPQTTFLVTVADGTGATVNGATVTVRNASVPDVSLTQAASGLPYTATVASFPSGDFRLDVVKGSDSVQGVMVGGPGMHTINAPAQNATVAAGQPLDVSWTTPSVAKQVSVQTRDLSSVSAPDTGDFTISGSQNPVRASQRVIVTRTNEVEAAGGLMNSKLTVSYSNRVDPYTVQ